MTLPIQQDHSAIPVAQEITNPLVNVVRFIHSIMRRKWILLCWMTLTISLGIAHFIFSPRVYNSSAELLILHTGEGNLDQAQQTQKTLQDQLPTYTKVIESEEVLKGALQRLPQAQRAEFLGMSKQAATNKLRQNINVTSTRNTNLMQVSYQAHDPESAAIIVTEILNSYFSFMQDTHQNSSREILTVLTSEQERIERLIQEKQQDLLNLRSKTDSLLGTGDGVMSVVNERVIELNRTLAAAQKESIEARSFYVSVEHAVRNGEDLQQYIAQTNAAVASELMKIGIGVDSRDSYAYSRFQQQLIEDQAKLSDKLNNKYGPNHPEVVELRQRIQSTQQWLNSRTSEVMEGSNRINRELAPRILQMAHQRLQHAAQKEQDISNRFQQEKAEAALINQQLVQVQMAERDLARAQSDYEMVRDRINTLDLNQQVSLRTRITKHAVPNSKPANPRLVISLMLGMLSGFVLGLGNIVILNLIDDKFHSPEELRSQVGAPVLTMIREMTPLYDQYGLQAIQTHIKPNSVEVESFRTLRTAIEFSGEEHRRISISSTEPGDGKTTVISNMAVAFAQAGRRTLVIDGDMRRPGLTRLFNLKIQAGLSSILRDNRPIADCAPQNIIRTAEPNLDIMPAGPRPGNPVELLTTGRFSELLDWAEGDYHQILIDAPPSLAVTDPAIIGRLVDGVILVVCPEKNHRRMILRASDSLQSLGANLIGLVVNRLTGTQGDYSYGYGYGYGYGQDEANESETNYQPSISTSQHESAPAQRKRFSRNAA